MQQAGMRWTRPGAQAVLDLRAVRLNADRDTSWWFHRQQHRRLDEVAAPPPATVEDQALKLVA